MGCITNPGIASPRQINILLTWKFVECNCILDLIALFNQPVSIKLDSKDDFALYIGKGYAHGFLSYSDNTTVVYSTSTIHDKTF